MGDNRQATRAPGPAPDAKKKNAGADAGGGGAVPEGATADPGSALMALGAQHAANLLGMLQSAGGNAEVNELTSLEQGKAVAAQAKSDKDNVDNMTDGQKVEKFGGKGEGSGAPPPPPGTPPEGAPAPGQVQGFHANRASQLNQLASQHKTVAGQLSAGAGDKGLAPEMAGFLGQASAQSLAQGDSLTQLASAYLATSKELGKSEFVGAAMPNSSVQGEYVARANAIQAQVTALDAMTAEYAAALAAEQARIAGIDMQIGELQKQIAEEQAKKADKKDGAAPKGEVQSKELKVEAPGGAQAKGGEKSGPGPGAKGADAKGAGGKGAGDGGKGAGEKAGEKAKAPEAPSPMKAGADAKGEAKQDQVPVLTEQMKALQQQKTAIETAIRSNQGLVSTMGAYRSQMQALLSAYQTVLNITPPKA